MFDHHSREINHLRRSFIVTDTGPLIKRWRAGISPPTRRQRRFYDHLSLPLSLPPFLPSSLLSFLPRSLSHLPPTEPLFLYTFITFVYSGMLFFSLPFFSPSPHHSNPALIMGMEPLLVYGFLAWTDILFCVLWCNASLFKSTLPPAPRTGIVVGIVEFGVALHVDYAM